MHGRFFTVVFNLKKVFISGKMTGLPVDVFQKNFKDAEEYLINKYKDYEIINPCNLKFISNTPSLQMLEVLNKLSQCDYVYFLSNWKDSNGSQCEYWFAKMLGITAIMQE